MQIDLTVNGKRAGIDAEPRLLLAHALRDYLNLTGTHIGCDTTHCGACTVLLDGVPVGLFQLDPEGRMTLLNPEAARFFRRVSGRGPRRHGRTSHAARLLGRGAFVSDGDRLPAGGPGPLPGGEHL